MKPLINVNATNTIVMPAMAMPTPCPSTMFWRPSVRRA